MPSTVLTLAANTDYNLLKVLNGTTVGIAATTNPNWTPSCMMVRIQNDPVAPASTLWVRQSNTDNATGFVVLAANEYHDWGRDNVVSLGDIWLRSDTGSAKVNVLWRYA